MKNIFSKLSKKVIIIVIVAVVVVAFIVGSFLKKDSSKYTLAKVERGTVVQEVAETGTVKTGEEVSLAFKASGTVSKVYVFVGDDVKAGQSLASLDSNQLYIQLESAKANLAMAQAKLDKLNNGASPQEIASSQTAVSNAQIALDTANKSLSDYYKTAENTLDSSYLYAYNALAVMNTIQKTYFTLSDQQGANFLESKNLADSSLQLAKSAITVAKQNNQLGTIDNALSQMKTTLDIFAQSLTIIRQLCEDNLYTNRVSSTDKTSLDTQRTYINTALSNILSAQQTISTRTFAVSSAQGQLKSAQDQLNLLTANPRQEDVDLYKAQVDQAQAQVNLIYQQISDNIIKAPTDGQVTDIIKKVGESIQATAPEISFISASELQIKTDVYEEDVVKIKTGDSTEISFIAFPDKTFSGKVLEIDPAQKVIGGVVYYEVAIAFDQKPSEEIKPGMTADVKIKTAQKDNVLYLPQDAINKKDGKTFVDILKDDKKSETIEVSVGLEGSDDRIEIISGLQEGQQVIIK